MKGKFPIWFFSTFRLAFPDWAFVISVFYLNQIFENAFKGFLNLTIIIPLQI